MFDKKRKKALTKLVILVLLLILVIRIFTLTLSKFQSTSYSEANVDLAFYLLNVDKQSMTLNLDSIFPRDTPYVYSFSIGNTNGQKTSEIDIEYDLEIKTTTNLPLTYELYLNQNYTDNGAINIITSNQIIQDENLTYFRQITTNKKVLRYTSAETNVYNLVVYFPSTYNTTNYQDIFESIEINVNSRQVTE